MTSYRIILTGCVIAAAAGPWIITSDYYIRLINLTLVFGLLAVSLNIVMGYAGQLSLGHAAFFGIGAYATALITATRDGILFWPSLIPAAVVTGALGIVIGVPALRLSGHYLALATLGFGEIVRQILYNWRSVTHGMDGILAIPGPALGPLRFDTDRTFFYVALAALGGTILLVRRLEQSKYGRMLTAIRDAELAAGTCGVAVTRLKILAFVLSAVIAGVAGALYASLMTFISPDVFGFELTASTISMIVIGGIGTTWGPVLGAAVVTLLPEVLRISKAYYVLIYCAGVAAIVIFLPGGIMGLLRGWIDRRNIQTDEPAPAQREATVAAETFLPPTPSEQAGLPLLQVHQLTRRFGGLVAVDQLDIAVAAGTIHALIGPNGSGKSTFINLASGVYKSSAGRIVFAGSEVTDKPTWTIARLGLLRTFQNLRLFRTLTVAENVLVGCHSQESATLGNVLLATHRSKAEELELRARAHDALAFMGLWDIRDRIVQTLPHERQRMVEVARAIAGQPRLLMLDEPAAGLNLTEVEFLSERIYRLRDAGMGILLIEHNVPLVMRIADRITVLNFGRKIAEGAPTDIRQNPSVIEAYLGRRSARMQSAHVAIGA